MGISAYFKLNIPQLAVECAAASLTQFKNYFSYYSLGWNKDAKNRCEKPKKSPNF